MGGSMKNETLWIVMLVAMFALVWAVYLVAPR